MLRTSFGCSKCGHKGATLTVPSAGTGSALAGYLPQPFPAGEMSEAQK
jgi:hypothetical protein